MLRRLVILLLLELPRCRCAVAEGGSSEVVADGSCRNEGADASIGDVKVPSTSLQIGLDLEQPRKEVDEAPAAADSPPWMADVPPGYDIVYIDVEEEPAYDEYQEGFQLQEAGQYAAALACYERAQALMPPGRFFFRAAVNIGFVLGNLGEAARSEAVYRDLAEREDTPPKERALALSNLANTWSDSAANGDFALLSTALEAAQMALQLQPDHHPALNNAGLLLLRLGRPAEAGEVLRRLVALDPCHVDALLTLGNADFQRNYYALALGSYRQILECTAAAGPTEHRGVALYMVGQFFRQAANDYAKALRFFVLAAQENLDYPETAETTITASITAAGRPGGRDRALALLAAGLPATTVALAAGKAAGFAHAPSLAGIIGAVRTLCLWVRWEELMTVVAWGARQQLPPPPAKLQASASGSCGAYSCSGSGSCSGNGSGSGSGCGSGGGSSATSGSDAAQVRIEDYNGDGGSGSTGGGGGGERRLDEGYGPWLMPYDALLLGEMTGSELRRLAETHAANRAGDAGAGLARGRQAVAAASVALRSRKTPLSVAYWSYDFRGHPMGYLTEGVICGHARLGEKEGEGGKAPLVLATVASFGPDDGSELRQRLIACSHRFLDFAAEGDAAAAAALAAAATPEAAAAAAAPEAAGAVAGVAGVAEMAPHVLVDLMGHTTSTRLGVPTQRPAPIVMTYLGFPGTVGSRRFDYSIVDKIVVPVEAAARRFTEKILYLPGSYQANNYALDTKVCSASNGAEGLRRCQDTARAEFGVAEALTAAGSDGDGPVICNHNNIEKMRPESFSLLCNILASTPGAILLLLLPSGVEQTAAATADGLKAEAAARGIHPSRIVFDKRVPKERHLERLSGVCDVFVDTLVYGAHTTAADALWGGVPLLTTAGFGTDEDPFGHMHSRVGASLLSAMGPRLGSTVAWEGVKSLQDIAYNLLSRPGALGRLRAEVQRQLLRRGGAFDTEWQTRRLERSYQAAWEVRQFATGGRAMHLVVDPEHSYDRYGHDSYDRYVHDSVSGCSGSFSGCSDSFGGCGDDALRRRGP